MVSQALVIAIRVRETRKREGLGWAIGVSEEQAFWAEFLRGLVGRGLAGVQLVTLVSAASAGVRNGLAHIRHGDKDMVAAIVRTVFAPPDRAAARQQVTEVVDGLDQHFPKAAALLHAAKTTGWLT